jgi:hypothetical protein
MASTDGQFELTKSKALVALEMNLDHIKRITALIKRDSRTASDIFSDASNLISAMKAELANLDCQQQMHSLEQIKVSLTPIRELVFGWKFLSDWMVVMLVTFVEAYLEDFLVMAVRLNPGWFRSEAAISYNDLLDESTIESLRDKIRRRWARKVLRSDGPSKWIGRLARYGIQGYREHLGAEMQDIWDRSRVSKSAFVR